MCKITLGTMRCLANEFGLRISSVRPKTYKGKKGFAVEDLFFSSDADLRHVWRVLDSLGKSDGISLADVRNHTMEAKE